MQENNRLAQIKAISADLILNNKKQNNKNVYNKSCKQGNWTALYV